MSDIVFPMKQNEQIETHYDTKFFCQSDKIIEIHFKKDNKFVKIEVSQNIAEIYYNFVQLLHNVNSKLHCEYVYYYEKDHLTSFSKRKYDLYDKLAQHSAIWFFFQKTQIKIQFSMTYKKEFLEFYKKSNIEIDSLLNTNQDQINEIFSGKNNNIGGIRQSKIVRYKSESVHDWINFNLISSEPLTMIFEFLKELPIIKS